MILVPDDPIEAWHLAKAIDNWLPIAKANGVPVPEGLILWAEACRLSANKRHQAPDLDLIAAPLGRVGDLVVNEDAHVAVRGETVLDLTRTEFQLLYALAQNHGRVMSKAQLFGHVWGSQVRDPSLVQVHISTLRRKLEAAGPRIIHTIRGAGYVLRP